MTRGFSFGLGLPAGWTNSTVEVSPGEASILMSTYIRVPKVGTAYIHMYVHMYVYMYAGVYVGTCFTGSMVD